MAFSIDHAIALHDPARFARFSVLPYQQPQRASKISSNGRLGGNLSRLKTDIRLKAIGATTRVRGTLLQPRKSVGRPAGLAQTSGTFDISSEILSGLSTGGTQAWTSLPQHHRAWHCRIPHSRQHRHKSGTRCGHRRDQNRPSRKTPENRS